MAQRTDKALNSKPALSARMPAATRAAEAGRRPRRDPVETVWVLFCSLRFAVVLNVALALAALLGTIIPQLQPGIQNFPTELDQFLIGARSRYGDFSGVLHWAGFYDLYNSLWFRMLVVLVVFSIVMCTLNRWGPIMRLIRNPAVRVSDDFVSGLSERAQFRAVPLEAAAAEQALRGALKRSRYRVLVDRDEGGSAVSLYADRDRWTKLVTFVSHAALVMVILAAVGMANFGWREQSVYFYPGKPVNVGHDLDFSVRQDAFAIDYYSDGTTVKEYKDTLAVIEGGAEVLTKTIIVNDPLRYKGVNFFLVSYQPVIYARAVDAEGKSMLLKRMGSAGPVTDTEKSGESLVDFHFTSSDNLPLDYLQMPVKDHVLTLELTYYQDVARDPDENAPVYVRAYVDKNFDTRIFDGFLPRTGPLKLPGYEAYAFTFRKDTAAILEAAKDPGLGLVGSFFFIMAMGFTISLYTSFTRIWARITPNEERPGTVNVVVAGLAEKNKVSFERDFEKTAGRVRDALVGAASSRPSEEGAQQLEESAAEDRS
ncbi:MAG: cytochrome c biogenesis protein ResB [Chloroflexia bacterium]